MAELDKSKLTEVDRETAESLVAMGARVWVLVSDALDGYCGDCRLNENIGKCERHFCWINLPTSDTLKREGISYYVTSEEEYV